MAKETAEQKLLKVIEVSGGGDTPAPAPAGEIAPSAQSQEAQKTLESVKSVGVSLPPFMQGIVTFIQGGHGFGLREINKILPVCIALVTVFFVMDFRKGMEGSKKEIRFAVPKTTAMLSDGILPAFRNVSEYVTVINRRNIFHPLEKKLVEKKANTSSDKQHLVEKITDLKLVGISWLDSAESATAMIEDDKTSITHFLKVGDSVKGVRIHTIYADSVILSYGQETITMSL